MTMYNNPVSNVSRYESFDSSNIRYMRFATCSNYYEQQTNAILNFWSFQKWANVTGFRVMEPYASWSELGFSERILQDYNFTNALRFRDYFDLDFWTSKTNKYHRIPPMATWDTFNLHSLRRTVVVILIYDVLTIGRYVDNDINKHSDCVKEKNIFYSKHSKLFDRLEIQVVRNVCYAFNYKVHLNDITFNQFNSFLLLENNINVWFSVWRGIRFDRIPIADLKILLQAHNEEESSILAMVKPSPRILADSRKFVNTILHADFNGYTTIAFRTLGRKMQCSVKAIQERI